MAEEPRKRSRFGDEPSEPPRRSKFDRRSRSPADRNATTSRRSRSPVDAADDAAADDATLSEAKAKALAAAARINAMIGQKKANPPAPAPVRLVRISSVRATITVLTIADHAGYAYW